MLLFQKRFLSGIVNGSVTTTFRRWPKLLVKPGGRYRVHPIGVIVVDAIERRSTRSITEREAVRAGFGNVAELIDYLDRRPSAASSDSQVWKIDFHYGGEDDRIDEALNANLNDEEYESLRAKLEGYDKRSESGPWTQRTLKLIQKHPRLAASKLAPMLKMEKLPFKANVVKLKKLGLTMSFEVGYELSPRGRTFVERRSRRKPARAQVAS